MPRYRKKPVEIEAMQLTQGNLEEVMEWIGTPALSTTQSFEEGLKIKTLEGTHLACWFDYIIKGVEDEFYPCKPGIFERTYEPVEQ